MTAETGNADNNPLPSDTDPGGHRVERIGHAWVIDAWGSDRATCMCHALYALVEGFAEVEDAPASRVVPLSIGPGPDEEVLGALFEEVIDAIDVFSVVPVRFHLTETEDGGVAGDMEVVSAASTTVIAPRPVAVPFGKRSMTNGDGGWRCHAEVTEGTTTAT
jgi:SHS2 domain-containing protein